MNRIFINTDGGSRGNPGPAGIGVVFYDQCEKVLHTHKERIGVGTNNEAEYRALIKAIEILLKSQWLKSNNNNENEAVFRLDSKLVVEQVCGHYKIKQPHIQLFINRINELIKEFDLKVSFIHIPREQNKLADKLVNEALDELIPSKQ